MSTKDISSFCPVGRFGVGRFVKTSKILDFFQQQKIATTIRHIALPFDIFIGQFLSLLTNQSPPFTALSIR